MEVVRNKVEEHNRTLDVLAKGYAYVHREQNSPSGTPMPGTPMPFNPKHSPLSARMGALSQAEGFNPNININISNNNALQQANSVQQNANMGGASPPMAGVPPSNEVGKATGGGRGMLQRPAALMSAEKDSISKESTGKKSEDAKQTGNNNSKQAGADVGNKKQSGNTGAVSTAVPSATTAEPGSKATTHFNIASPDLGGALDIENAALSKNKNPPPVGGVIAGATPGIVGRTVPSTADWFSSPEKPKTATVSANGPAKPAGTTTTTSAVPVVGITTALKNTEKGNKPSSSTGTENGGSSGTDSSSSTQNDSKNGFQRKKV
jgi:hypothetical protein